MAGKIILGILGVILLAIVITAIKAYFFKPKKSELERPPLEPENTDVKKTAEHLSKALTFQTIARTDPKETEWEEFRKFRDFLEESYPLIHKNLTKEIITDASLIFHWKGKDSSLKPIALLSHQDVVPVTPGTEDDWKYPPFSGHNDGEFIWGRGALDMKNHLICLMEAIETLLEEGYQPERDVYLCFAHDEEVNDNGLSGAVDIVKTLKARGIHLDSVLDEGGAFLTVKIKGIIDQSIAGIGMAEKGYSDYRITVNAKGGHSSQPPVHSALGDLAEVIRDLERHQFKAKLMPFMMDLFTSAGKRVCYPARLITCNIPILKPLILAICKKIPPAACLTRTTTAVTMAKGSPASNVLPQSASCTVNFRQMPGTSVKDVENHIRKVVKNKDIKIELLGCKEVSKFATKDSQAYRAIDEICSRTDPKKNFVAPFLVMSSTDAYHYGEICDNVLRFSPFRVSAELLMRTHATNECCPVDTLDEAVSFFKRYIRLASKAKEEDK